MRAISQEPIAQSSRSLLQSTCLYLPQGLVPSVSLISSYIPFLQTRHQNPPLHYCAVNISRTHSSIIPISFAIDSPIFAAGPGALSFSNFFIYPFLQARHQNPPLTTVQSISRKPITQSSRSFCNRLTYIHPSAWCPQFHCISPFYKLGIKIPLFTTVREIQ